MTSDDEKVFWHTIGQLRDDIDTLRKRLDFQAAEIAYLKVRE